MVLMLFGIVSAKRKRLSSYGQARMIVVSVGLLFSPLIYTCTPFQLAGWLVGLPHRFQYIRLRAGYLLLFGRRTGYLGALSLSAGAVFGISDVANAAPLTVGRALALHLKGKLRYQIPQILGYPIPPATLR